MTSSPLIGSIGTISDDSSLPVYAAIRSAIRERTGQDLPLDTVRNLLVEEGLITPAQARNKNLIFKGYADYLDLEGSATRDEKADQLIDKEFLHEDEQI